MAGEGDLRRLPGNTGPKPNLDRHVLVEFFAEHTPLAGFGEDIDATRDLLTDEVGAGWDDD
ncbi:hypothetical protein [Nocardia sp. CDC160]|uniref:hypothetical protein n=1 Tax=Nocardia sp. CDC160 TaxID=3112166 RepID=UPI002DB60F71|nr:hypothetical protein [Nocardia sp. CDC160]MEC3915442.1 hypothetical protein [Nocardia sp. CDC160]